jgi:hypothetical protein
MRPTPPELPDDPFSDNPDFILGVEGYYLDLMPYVERQWTCAAVGCTRHTTVRDYGHETKFWWRKRWLTRAENFYLCGPHARRERAFVKESRNLTVAEVLERLPFKLKERHEWCVFTGCKEVNFGPSPLSDDPDQSPLKT